MKSQQLIIAKMLSGILLSCSGILSIAYADDDDSSFNDLFALSLEELQQVTVNVASGTDQSVSKASATVTIITESQWQLLGATTLAEVLETIPGIILATPSRRWLWSITISGGSKLI